MWKHYLVGSFNKERAQVGVFSAGSLNSLLFRDCEIFAELRFSALLNTAIKHIQQTEQSALMWAF